ncbi:hypothetical protein [Amycolatopsis cihanbeyliensis]|uniref:Uncharacterized protein n=1 Tax=Amycolatopsis cihanbeyliensis TaxID=1128664 RepID=A0A542DDZ2_AMYCI|nr:hypothetical protein [Amycolatopsis cihanbeyliensis]TQJ01295.1 hypothetical protein FB471_0969 [Amycolatopsis cihanbeyliensis]
MHVLVTEAAFGDGDELVARLRAEGCTVSTCHSSSGICRALAPGAGCPLDGPKPVALMVDVRSAGPELTAREFGVVCAVRAGLQVALVPAEPGLPMPVPPGLRNRTTVATADQLADACHHALRTEAGRRRPA